MAVSIEAMLEALEELLEEGMSVPLSGGRRVVDIDQARDIIDDIRINMPQEILQAKAIVQDRARILAKAKKEAEETQRVNEIKRKQNEKKRNLRRFYEQCQKAGIDKLETESTDSGRTSEQCAQCTDAHHRFSHQERYLYTECKDHVPEAD